MNDSTPIDPAADPSGDVPDLRVYLTEVDDWEARVKNDSDKIYCYQKNPGEEFFHLILQGELYLVHGTEKYCLRCALRNGAVTQDRLFWQHGVRNKKSTLM